MHVLDAYTLPSHDNVNPYAYCVELQGEFFLQRGKMIAYYGQMRFEPLAVTSLRALVASRFSSPLYVQDWVVAVGQGKLLLGDRGYDINSYDLDAGNLTIRAANLLGFDPHLELKQSIVPGFVTLIGTGRFLASSNGPVVFLEPPLRVDPEALVGWADCPSPCHHYDAGYMSGLLGAVRGAVGTNTGEERQLDFTGSGTVLMQSSEVLRDDPTVLRTVEAQLGALSTGQLQRLQRTISARLSSS